jgi:hypothetical protein
MLLLHGEVNCLYLQLHHDLELSFHQATGYSSKAVCKMGEPQIYKFTYESTHPYPQTLGLVQLVTLPTSQLNYASPDFSFPEHSRKRYISNTSDGNPRSETRICLHGGANQSQQTRETPTARFEPLPNNECIQPESSGLSNPLEAMHETSLVPGRYWDTFKGTKSSGSECSSEALAVSVETTDAPESTAEPFDWICLECWNSPASCLCGPFSSGHGNLAMDSDTHMATSERGQESTNQDTVMSDALARFSPSSPRTGTSDQVPRTSSPFSVLSPMPQDSASSHSDGSGSEHRARNTRAGLAMNTTAQVSINVSMSHTLSPLTQAAVPPTDEQRNRHDSAVDMSVNITATATATAPGRASLNLNVNLSRGDVQPQDELLPHSSDNNHNHHQQRRGAVDFSASMETGPQTRSRASVTCGLRAETFTTRDPARDAWR